MWKIGKNLSTNTKHLPTQETTSSYTKHPTSSPEGKTGKVLSQLLLPCPIASDLWYFSSLVGISWVMPNSVISMLVSLNGMLGSHRYGTGGGGVWGIWGERNCHIFKDKESIVPNLNFLFLKALYEWEWKSSTFSMFSLIEFLDTPLLYC